MNQPVCKFYKRNGYCHFLNKCWYSHSSEPSSEKISCCSEVQTTAREINLENGAEEQRRENPERKYRRSNPLKRYGRRYANIRSNLKPKSFGVTRSTGSAVLNTEGDQDQDDEHSFEATSNSDDEHSTEATSNSYEVKGNESIVDAKNEGIANRKEKAPVSQNSQPFISRRRVPQGNRRWNVYKGPRYFYGNGRKNERVRRHGDSHIQPAINSEVKQSNISQNQTEDSSEVSPKKDLNNASILHTSNRSYGRFQMKTSDLSPEEFSKLLDTEIEQLKKRFPGHKIVEGENNTYQIEYSPSDPDWPFQISSLILQVKFPLDYPKVLFSTIVVNEGHYLPELLVKNLNKTVQNWLKERQERNENNGVTELVFRPFLKWLDKSLEDMFLNGLRLVKQEIDAQAAGIEFIPYENLCSSLQPDELSASLSNNLETTEFSNGNTENKIRDSYPNDEGVSLSEDVVCLADSLSASSPAPTTDASVTNDDVVEATQRISISDCGSSDRIKNVKGSKTEVKFKSLYLSGNAATLKCVEAQLAIQCTRCKTRHDLATVANKLNSAACTKCHATQKVFFQSTMMHPYSSVLGYMYLAQCKIVDLPLVSCEFSMECLNCTNQFPLTGVHYDQQCVTWCRFCNSKMAVSIQGVRFLEVPSGGIAGRLQAQTVKLDGKTVKNELIAVKSGKPLPENGTCKHYKKSYRWLRFPCCGKAYPCDLCHDEKEIDHEMKLAHRMICGFCAKEQPYSTECISCGSYTTKKPGSHWEGGKGCRDKHKMNKGDKHKYSGANKTKSIKKVGTNVKKNASQ